MFDSETGLYYLNARYYDSKIARFLSEDTYTGNPNDPLSLNLYTYCFNNPLIYWDPTGHVVTQWDRDHLSDDEISMLDQITKDWNDAYSTHDTSAMNIAHATAEALRDQYRKSDEMGSASGYTYTVSGTTATMYSGDSSLISNNTSGSVNGGTDIPSTRVSVSTLQSQQVVINKDTNNFSTSSFPGKLYASAGNICGFDLGINNDKISSYWTKTAYYSLGSANYLVDFNDQLHGTENCYEQYKRSIAIANSLNELSKMLKSGAITKGDLLKMLGDSVTDSMVGGLLYVIDNYSIMQKDVTTTKYNAFMLGYNTGRAGFELLTLGATVKGLASLAKASVAAKAIPRGFSNASQVQQCTAELEQALAKSGLDAKSIQVRGSAATGVSSKGGDFRVEAQNGLKPSDIDVGIEFKDPVSDITTSKNQPGFIHPDKMMKNFPELKAWSEKWSNILGRDITPGGWQPGTLPSEPSNIHLK